MILEEVWWGFQTCVVRGIGQVFWIQTIDSPLNLSVFGETILKEDVVYSLVVKQNGGYMVLWEGGYEGYTMVFNMFMQNGVDLRSHLIGQSGVVEFFGLV